MLFVAQIKPIMRSSWQNPGVNRKNSRLPLSGLDVVLTRPVGSARSMQRSLMAAGARCVNLPVITIRDLPQSPALRTALTTAAGADALVFASPNAVHGCYRLLPRFRARGLVFAQGPATARALRRRGVDAILPDGGYTSEDVLRHNFFGVVAGKRVVRLAGQGGRDLLLSSLRARGCDASAIALYRRVPARWQQRHRDILRAYADPVLVISSAETLEGLRLRLVKVQWERLCGWRMLVSSARLEAAALDAGCAHVHVARSAASADLRAGLMALTEASRGR